MAIAELRNGRLKISRKFEDWKETANAERKKGISKKPGPRWGSLVYLHVDKCCRRRYSLQWRNSRRRPVKMDG